ncbi:MAG: chemotaxis protein CheD [Bacteroidales bacterium]|nr:chemotaxis protein CheD [Bacteroidales bacterium]
MNKTEKTVVKQFLYPSAIIVSTEPCEVTTILGSCIAVCIIDPVLCIGGINHYMLPLWNGIGLASPKYGNVAIEKLIDKLIMLGSKKDNLTAKVFGGGEVLETNSVQYNIGLRNIEIVREILNEKRIPVISSSLGGSYGRKIIFKTHTGEVKHFFINKNFQIH